MSIAQVQSVIEDPSKLKDLFGSTPTLIGDIVVDVLLGETPILSWEFIALTWDFNAHCAVYTHPWNTMRLESVL